MSKKNPLDLAPRERQVLETVYSLGRASVAETLDALSDPPSYSAVRAILNNLEAKGRLRRVKSGRKYLYAPTTSREKVRRSALSRLVSTFFNGSPAQAAASLLEMDDSALSEDDLDRLQRLIEEARKRGE